MEIFYVFYVFIGINFASSTSAGKNIYLLIIEELSGYTIVSVSKSIYIKNDFLKSTIIILFQQRMVYFALTNNAMLVKENFASNRKFIEYMSKHFTSSDYFFEIGFLTHFYATKYFLSR